MKEVIINNSLSIIRRYYPDYSEEKMAELKYGLLSIYLTVSKSIIIFGIAIILGVFKELLIFTIIYNILRAPSFGMHASKSWICLLSSTLVFILASLICKNIEFSMGFRVIFGLIGIILMYKNSPADTKKKPIVSPKRRKTYKIISTVLAISFVILSLIINNVFLDNSFILALIIQNVLISPATYKLFNEPYNNYKSYQF